MGGFTEINSVFDTAAQPKIKVRLPLGSPRLGSGPFPRLIHGAARHNTVAAPSFPYPNIIRRRTDVPFQTCHPYECSQDGSYTQKGLVPMTPGAVQQAELVLLSVAETCHNCSPVAKRKPA
jgi:hypothetical protein